MIDKIIENVRANVAAIAFVSKSGGLVREQVKDKLKFPVVAVPNDTCTGDYDELLPNSKEMGIIFFELISNNANETTTHRVHMVSDVRICIWFKTTNMVTPDVDLFSAHVASKIIKTTFSGLPSYIHSPKITLTAGIDYKNPYSRYTLDENKTQFLMRPFAGFSMNFKVDYFYLTDCLPAMPVIDSVRLC
jgi:hypothetical protein